MAVFLVIIIFLVFFVLITRAGEEAKKEADKRAYEAMIKSPEYLAEQERIKQDTIKGYEKIAKEAEEDPDKNIWDNNYFDMRKVHIARLEKFGRSKFNGETYYIGSRGGIYTISANGTRNYKY